MISRALRVLRHRPDREVHRPEHLTPSDVGSPEPRRVRPERSGQDPRARGRHYQHRNLTVGGSHDDPARSTERRIARHRRAERGGGGAPRRDDVIANINTLVDKARAEDVPVIWVQHCDDDLTGAPKRGSTCPNSCAVEAEPLVHKCYGDSFEDTDLEAVLAERRVGRLVVDRRTDRRVRPFDDPRRIRPRVRRDARRRCAHDRRPHGVGRASAGAGDRAHEPVLARAERAAGVGARRSKLPRSASSPRPLRRSPGDITRRISTIEPHKPSDSGPAAAEGFDLGVGVEVTGEAGRVHRVDQLDGQSNLSEPSRYRDA